MSDETAIPTTTGAEGAPREVGALAVRTLVYGDLPSVLAIERRSFQTPWSLAMFVLELSKPSGICLAVANEQGLVGYLVCSRYADVWHLMNIAVVPERRREGIATELMRAAVRGGRARGPLHARGADLEPRARSRCTSGSASGPPATGVATTTTTARTP